MGEAASGEGGRSGKGGDFLYRFGNPDNFGGDGDAFTWGQHDSHWSITDDSSSPSNNVMMFVNNPVEYCELYGMIHESVNSIGNKLDFYYPNVSCSATEVFEIALPEPDSDGVYDIMTPPSIVWKWKLPMRCEFVSSTQRLINGNTFINDGCGCLLYEVSPEGDLLWEFEMIEDRDIGDSYFLQFFNCFDVHSYDYSHPGIQAIGFSQSKSGDVFYSEGALN